MKKRVLSLLLALTLALSLLPAAAWAGDVEGGGITITFSASKGDVGFYFPSGEITVAPGTAAAYGYSNGSGVGADKVTMLDALVKAHVNKYGSAFTSAPNNYLVVSSSGFVTKAFGEQSSNSAQLVNGGILSDDLGNGYTANTAVLSDGDCVKFIFFADPSSCDIYSYFADDSGNLLVSAAVRSGGPLGLTLMGGCLGSLLYPSYYGPYVPAGLDGSEGEGVFSLYYVDSSGELKTPIGGVTPDADGKFTLTAPADPGTYILSAMDVDSADTPITLPWLKLTVTDGEPTAVQTAAAAMENLTWSQIGGANKSPSTLRENFTLPTSVYPGTTIAWSCADYDYNVFSIYGNKAYVTRPTSGKPDRSFTLKAEIKVDGSDEVQATKTFAVTVPAESYNGNGRQTAVDFNKLMDGIAGAYTSTADPWVILDMAGYGTDLYGSNTPDTTTVANCAKWALAQHAAGKDCTGIVTAMLALDSGFASTPNIAAFALLASQAANNAAGITGYKTALLNAQKNGGWNYGYGDAADVDTTAMVVAALAPYYGSDAGIKTAVDKAVSFFSSSQDTNGAWGNANSTAMVVTALSALGIDAHTDTRFIKNFHSAAEGLLYYGFVYTDPYAYPASTDYGFGYGGNVVANTLATEQGFRALVAYARFKESKAAYNIYLDADVSKEAPTDPNIKTTTVPDYVPPTGSITVSFTLVGDTVHGNGPHTAYITWIPATTITVQSGSTVGTVFTSILSKNSYTYVGAAQGYVSSITTPGGVTLSEKSNGKNSGWMYSVNGVDAAVGLNDYVLSNGDTIRWFYEDDYTTRSGMGGDSQKPGTSADVKYVDVSEAAWYKDAVSYVAKKGLIAGTGADTFSPSATLSRAMLVTALWNLAGNPSATACAGFVDVADGAYYAEAVNWAKSAGVAAGYGSAFGANDPITRQQLAAMLFGYAKRMGYDTAKAASLAAFTDVGSITDWAKAAAEWANAEGLMTGRTTSTLAPLGTATRAETATVLMRFCTNLIK